MLLEIGEAAGERMPARVDNPRIGEDQPDQADMGPVVGQLVDEIGSIGEALHLRAVEIFLTQ